MCSIIWKYTQWTKAPIAPFLKAHMIHALFFKSYHEMQVIFHSQNTLQLWNQICCSFEVIMLVLVTIWHFMLLTSNLHLKCHIWFKSSNHSCYALHELFERKLWLKFQSVPHKKTKTKKKHLMAEFDSQWHSINYIIRGKKLCEFAKTSGWMNDRMNDRIFGWTIFFKEYIKKLDWSL